MTTNDDQQQRPRARPGRASSPEPQPYACALTIAYTSTSRPAVTVTAPATSDVVGPLLRARVRDERRDSSAAAMPIGRLMKKIQRHESDSVRMPPSTRPTAPPPAAIALQTPSAFVRSGPSANVVVTIESAAGETSAAPSPCRARPAISTPDDVARPLSSEAAVKTTSRR